MFQIFHVIIPRKKTRNVQDVYNKSYTINAYKCRSCALWQVIIYSMPVVGTLKKNKKQKTTCVTTSIVNKNIFIKVVSNVV